VRPPRATLAMLLLTAAACGSAEAPSAPGSANAPLQPAHGAVQLAVTPDPVPSTVIASAPGDSSVEHQAAWTLTITETAGVGGTLNFLNVTLRDQGTGAVAEPGGETSLGAADIAALAGTARLAPNGMLTLPGQLVYALPDASVGGRLAMTLQITDDTGQLVTSSVSVPVS
jgi:hypothetical protein